MSEKNKSDWLNSNTISARKNQCFAYAPYNEDVSRLAALFSRDKKARIRKTQESLQLSPVTGNHNVLTIGKRKGRQQKHFKKQLS